MWLMHEMQLQITNKKHDIISGFYIYFQVNVQLFAIDSYRKVGKNPQVNLDMTV